MAMFVYCTAVVMFLWWALPKIGEELKWLAAVFVASAALAKYDD
jgi:hypothetical protein